MVSRVTNEERVSLFGTLYARRNPRLTKDTRHAYDQTVVERAGSWRGPQCLHPHHHIALSPCCTDV